MALMVDPHTIYSGCARALSAQPLQGRSDLEIL